MPNPNTPTVPVPRDVAERLLEYLRIESELSQRRDDLVNMAEDHVSALSSALAAPTTEQSSAVQQPALAAPAASEGWSGHLHDAMNRNEYFDVLFRMPNGRYENHAAIWDCCMEMWNLKSYDGAEYLGQYAAIGYRPLHAPAPKEKPNE